MGGMDMGRAGWQTACGSDRIWASRKVLRGGLVDVDDKRIDSREVLLIPPPLIPPLTSLKGRKGLGTFAKSRLARTAGRAVRLCRPPRGRTSASLRGLTCHSCHRHGWPEKNLYTELVVLRP